jgi:hypothetical protein
MAIRPAAPARPARRDAASPPPLLAARAALDGVTVDLVQKSMLGVSVAARRKNTYLGIQ